MENRYTSYRQGIRRNEEFQEEDVWGVVEERNDSDSRVMASSYQEPSVISKRLPTATRMIPKSSNKRTASQETKVAQHSAPVNIPDWSKIYGASSKKSYSWLDADSDNDGRKDRSFARSSSWESEDEDEDGEDGPEGNVIPPHEWIARNLAGSQISSFSVYEGAGRKLKGRDLSRVRNAVLTKTGFLESESNF